MKIAIVTGASSGLGRSFVKKIDKINMVDEIWVIARRKARLKKLQDICNIKICPIPLDLADLKSIDDISKLLELKNPEVKILVNAAGLGKIGTYKNLTMKENQNMLDINASALMNMTNTILPYMSKGSRVFQIASSASFQPLPGLNVYAATKAFVRSFTRALRWELFGTGIHMIAVCPGWIKTEFISVAKKTKGSSSLKHFPLPVTPEFVVNYSWVLNSINLPIATCGFHTLIQRLAAKFLPSWLIMGCWEFLNRFIDLICKLFNK